MNTHQNILYGVASQTLRLVCPDGRPSAITSVKVFSTTTGDDGTTQVATTGSASVTTNPNTTVDANSGDGQANPRVLNVAATTGFAVGEFYQVVGASNESEFFEVTEINSGVSVTARSPLHNAYVSGDTVHTTEISIAVLDSWAATKSKLSLDTDPNPGYRCRWVFTVTPAGSTSRVVVRDTYFDLVRYEGDQHEVTPADMERFYPPWRISVPTYHREDNGQRLIDEAFQQVKFDLHQSGIDDAMVRNTEVTNELVKHRARADRLRDSFLEGGSSFDAYELAREAYQSRFDQLIRVTNKTDIATDTSGAGGPVEAVGIWSK